MSLCVLLSPRLFTVCLEEKRQPNCSAADRLEGFPPERGGAALSGSGVLKRGVWTSVSVCSFLPRCSGWLQLQGDRRLDVNTRAEGCANCGLREAVGCSAVLRSPGASVCVVGST